MDYNNNEKALIWLSMPIGISACKRLQILENFTDAEEMFDNFDEEKPLFEAVLGENACAKLREVYDVSLVDKYINEMNRMGIIAVTLASDDYPIRLRHIIDSPVCLYCKGNVELMSDSLSMAIIGTRKISTYGKDVARMLARELCYNKFTIVSGLARGVDTIAHQISVDNDCRTIAVLGNGLDIVYPRENTALAERIAEKGLLISEYPLGTQPYSYNFPPRNRIISALSNGVLVIEAGERSGTMITVDYALDQGKDIFAVPGNIFNDQSIGTNKLIKEGSAYLVSNINDILSVYSIKSKHTEVSSIQLSFIEQSIVKELNDGDKHFEELLAKSNLEVHNLISVLTNLELVGIIRKLPGNYYGKVQGVF